MWATQAVTAKQLYDWVWHLPPPSPSTMSLLSTRELWWPFSQNLKTCLSDALCTHKAFSTRVHSKTHHWVEIYFLMSVLQQLHYAFTIRDYQSCVSAQSVSVCVHVCVPFLMSPQLIVPGCQPCSGSSRARWVPAQCALLLVLPVTCGSMWGFCRSMQEEGDLLCSQLFRPVLTVLWNCVGETVWLPPSLLYTLTDCLSLLPLQLAKHMLKANTVRTTNL